MRLLPDPPPWVFDLVSDDDTRRAAALARHRAVLAESHALRRRADAAWAERVAARQLADKRDRDRADQDGPDPDRGDGRPGGPERAAENAYHRARGRTLTGLVSAFTDADPAVRDRYSPYAVLYLRWAEWFPDELAGSWSCSPWTTKEVVLRDLARRGVPAGLEDEVGELIVAALRRPYRCKDWRYAGLLRHVVPDGLAGLDDDRARFARHVIDHPELTVTRSSYPRWLAGQPARCLPGRSATGAVSR